MSVRAYQRGVSELDLSGAKLDLTVRRGADVRITLYTFTLAETPFDLDGFTAHGRLYSPSTSYDLTFETDGASASMLVPNAVTLELTTIGPWRWVSWLLEVATGEKTPLALGFMRVEQEAIG